jgi:signal transduction histidine kinase
LKYIFWLFISGLILVSGISFVFYKYISENYSLLVELSPMTDVVKTQLAAELNVIVFSILFGSLVFLILVSMMGLIFSHRVAGPIFHISRVLSEIRDGNVDARITLRPKDEFQELADEVNKTLDFLDAKKNNLKN